jgi:replicative DNA helicase
MIDPIKTFSDPDVEEQMAKWLVREFPLIEPFFHNLPLDYFVTDYCRAVHRAVTRLHNAGQPVDDVVVIHEAGKLVDDVTRPIIIAMITDTSGVTRSAFTHHLKVLRDYWKRRTLQDATKAAGAASDPAEIAAIWQSALEAVADPPPAPPSMPAILTAWKDNLTELATGRKQPGVLTRIPGLDEITCGGLRPGELWVVGGGTASGKTAAAIQLAGNVLDTGHAVFIASLEMPVCQIIDRFVCNRGSVFLSKLRDPATHPLNQMDLHAIKRVIERMSEEWRVEIHDEATDLDVILAGAAGMKKRIGLDVLVIDYLQIATIGGDYGTRERAVAEISRRLKRFAVTEGVTVIALSQLNDQGEIRESRAIGHDADLVAKIVDDGIAIQKNRNGESGNTLPLILDGKRQTFQEVRKEAAA